MSQEAINMLILSVCFLSLFGVAEFLHHKLGIQAEMTRKLVHFGTGILALSFPLMLGNHWLVLALCASFAVILSVAMKTNLLNSINGIDRVSHGSLSYPLVVYICYLAYDYSGANLLVYYLPILTLAICDPVAALTGKHWPYGKFLIGDDQKTIMGSSAFAISSAMLTLSTLYLLSPGLFNLSQAIPLALAVAATVALAEALSSKGFDNLTIPLMVVVILMMFT